MALNEQEQVSKGCAILLLFMIIAFGAGIFCGAYMMK